MMLINIKMPTIFGILTFMSMVNTVAERLKARKLFICWYFSFYEQLKFRAELSWAWKKFYNLGARLEIWDIFNTMEADRRHFDLWLVALNIFAANLKQSQMANPGVSEYATNSTIYRLVKVSQFLPKW